MAAKSISVHTNELGPLIDCLAEGMAMTANGITAEELATGRAAENPRDRPARRQRAITQWHRANEILQRAVRALLTNICERLTLTDGRLDEEDRALLDDLTHVLEPVHTPASITRADLERMARIILALEPGTPQRPGEEYPLLTEADNALAEALDAYGAASVRRHAMMAHRRILTGHLWARRKAQWDAERQRAEAEHEEAQRQREERKRRRQERQRAKE